MIYMLWLLSCEKRAVRCLKIDESEYGKFAWVIDPEAIKSSCGSRLLTVRQPSNMSGPHMIRYQLSMFVQEAEARNRGLASAT